MDQAESSPSPGQPEPARPRRPDQPAPRPDSHAEYEVPALRLEHPVVAGYDGSASSRNALAYAAGLSLRLGRPLLIVYVCSSGVYCEPLTGQVVGVPRDADALERWLLAELDQVTGSAELDVHVRTRRGSPARELAAAAEEFSADALVIGAPTHIWHRIAGSVSGWLARHARCPVIVVPLRPTARGGIEIEVVMVWARRDLNPHVLSDTRT
jgi:nucleotide-binding universal stress UspA family protein